MPDRALLDLRAGRRGDRAPGGGIGAVILFGIPASKDEAGSGAYDPEGVVQMAVRALKDAHPDLVVITDVCLCEYTSHGHCGVVRDGEVDNDLTVELLAKTAISHADAGADVVAPSDMMDGRVGRSAASSTRRATRTSRSSPTAPSTPRPSTGRSATPRSPPRSSAIAAATRWTRRTRSRAPRGEARPRRGRRRGDGEARHSLPRRDPPGEGRDRGSGRRLPRLRRVLDAEGRGPNGWIDERSAVLETLTAIRRAGADLVCTYYAKEAAAWL